MIYGAVGIGATGLMAINGTVLVDADMCFALDGTLMRIYYLDADSGLPVSSPDVIAPTLNAGTKRWILGTFV
jgi:hypothetical protein